MSRLLFLLKNGVVFTTIVLLLSSCVGETNNFADIIVANSGKADYVWDSADSSFRYIPLETTQECLITSCDKVMISDSIICVVELAPRNQVFVFDKDGRYKCKINKQGRAYGEYLNIQDANLDGDVVSLLDIGSRKMLHYNVKGELISEVVFEDYRPAPFAMLEDNHVAFFASMPKVTAENSEIIVTNKKGDIVKQFVPRIGLSIDEGRFSNASYFAKNKKGTFVIPMFDDKIYRLSLDGLSEVFDLGLKSKMYSYDEIGGVEFSKFSKFAFFYGFFMSDDGTFVCHNFHGIKPVSICGNIYSGELKTWGNDINIIGTYKDFFIGCVSAESIEPQIKETSDSDNPVLLLIESKRFL